MIWFHEGLECHLSPAVVQECDPVFQWMCDPPSDTESDVLVNLRRRVVYRGKCIASHWDSGRAGPTPVPVLGHLAAEDSPERVAKRRALESAEAGEASVQAQLT